MKGPTASCSKLVHLSSCSGVHGGKHCDLGYVMSCPVAECACFRSILLRRRWRDHIPPKSLYPYTRVYGVITGIGIAYSDGYGLDDRRVEVRVPGRSRMSSSPRRTALLWGTPTSHPMGTRDSFPGSKAAGT